MSGINRAVLCDSYSPHLPTLDTGPSLPYSLETKSSLSLSMLTLDLFETTVRRFISKYRQSEPPRVETRGI
jgi:hypothetical protein